jgi:DNA-binding HxlR family transcriptional regulator
MERDPGTTQEGTFMVVTNKNVPRAKLPPPDCKGLTDILATVGDKWTILIVGALFHRKLRYKELQREVSGISQRMLTLTLKRLEADGLVTRTLFPTVPPRVEYELTAIGHTLRDALVPLATWAAENKVVILRKRALQDK